MNTNEVGRMTRWSDFFIVIIKVKCCTSSTSPVFDYLSWETFILMSTRSNRVHVSYSYPLIISRFFCHVLSNLFMQVKLLSRLFSQSKEPNQSESVSELFIIYAYCDFELWFNHDHRKTKIVWNKNGAYLYLSHLVSHLAEHEKMRSAKLLPLARMPCCFVRLCAKLGTIN